MRLKYDLEDPNKYKCCVFVHVRVGTVILGIWNMLVHILFVACLVTVTLHPELLKDSLQRDTSVDSNAITVVEADNSNKVGGIFEIQYDTQNVNSTIVIRQKNLCVAFALVICTFFITLMMVYGAIRSRPGYLMPFFCLQVFYFCITCFSIVGYMNYTPDVKLWIRQQKLSDFPGMDKLLQLDEKWLMLMFVAIFVLVLSVKAYLINMVWATYTFLQLVNASRNVVQQDNEMLLPPKYEEAMKMSYNEPAPPPYLA